MDGRDHTEDSKPTTSESCQVQFLPVWLLLPYLFHLNSQEWPITLIRLSLRNSRKDILLTLMLSEESRSKRVHTGYSKTHSPSLPETSSKHSLYSTHMISWKIKSVLLGELVKFLMNLLRLLSSPFLPIWPVFSPTHSVSQLERWLISGPRKRVEFVPGITTTERLLSGFGIMNSVIPCGLVCSTTTSGETSPGCSDQSGSPINLECLLINLSI